MLAHNFSLIHGKCEVAFPHSGALDFCEVHHFHYSALLAHGLAVKAVGVCRSAGLALGDITAIALGKGPPQDTAAQGK